jgi:hypothetical protein
MARRRNGPGSFSKLIGGAFGILMGGCFGILIAAVYLTFRPVHEVKRMPAEEDMKPGVYYIEGRRSGMDGAEWVSKRNEVVAEGALDITVNEQELNQWSSATFSDRRMDLKIEYGDAKFEPGIPNFRIADDQVQIGFPFDIKGVGDNRRLIFQAKGTFVEGPDATRVFVPEYVYLGSCRIPNLGGFSAVVVRSLANVVGAPEEVLAAWPSLTDVTVDGDVIKLQRL